MIRISSTYVLIALDQILANPENMIFQRVSCLLGVFYNISFGLQKSIALFKRIRSRSQGLIISYYLIQIT